MKIVHAEELPLVDGLGGHAGSWKTRNVLRGEPGLDNFSLLIYYVDDFFFSPRHHHNFDQWRYQIDGKADFARNGKMKPGALGYFPEGAYYGPTSGPVHTVATLQFGGPSGSGFMGSAGRGAREALLKEGWIENGVYHRNPGVEGKKSQDLFEASWEYINKRPLVYPKPQYLAPIIMNTEELPWSPMDSVPGVEEQALGTFTNCKIRGARYRLAAGADFVASGRGVYMVLSGVGTLENGPYVKLTTLYLDAPETATFHAEEATTIVLMGMPSLAQISKQPPVKRASDDDDADDADDAEEAKPWSESEHRARLREEYSV